MSVSSPSPTCPPSPVVLLLVGSQLRSCEFSVAVWRAGPQPRSREFSVACRTPTAILRVQCGAPDPNRDLCEFSVACRTPTAISASSVWRARTPTVDPVRKFVRKNGGRYVRKPHPRSCEFSVAARTPTAIL